MSVRLTVKQLTQQLQPLSFLSFSPCNLVRTFLVLVIGCAALSMPVGGVMAAEAPAPTVTPQLKALAVRFDDAARALARTPDMAPELQKLKIQRIASLIAAARRCDPGDVRYARLHADLLIQLGQVNEAMAALSVVRNLTHDPSRQDPQSEDREAQIQTMDLYVSTIQTVPDKIDYFAKVTASPGVSSEVKSAAALRRSLLLHETKQVNLEIQALAEAVKLNPLNFTAQLRQWDQTKDKATPGQRVAMLIAMIRANPRETQVLQMLGKQLAAMGMVPESITWFTHTLNVAQNNRTLSLDILFDLGTALFLKDSVPQAQQIFETIIANDTSNSTALIMRSLLETRQAQPDRAKASRTQARNILINQLNTVRTSMGAPKIGPAAATTKPTNLGEIFMPDLANDADLFKSQKTDTRIAYLQSLADLAWFQVFFNDQTVEADKLAKILDNLMDPADRNASPILPRLMGWIYLKNNQLGEAEGKLSAVHDRDALAELGLVQIMVARGQADLARATARKLLNTNPSGVPGAVIADRVRGLNVLPEAIHLTPDGHSLSGEDPEVRSALNTLPEKWMDIISAPAKFYSISGKADAISTPFGMPIYMTVTVRNISDLDLSVANDGVIWPMIVFDAQVTGGAQQSFPGIATERLTQGQILKPRQSMSVRVRVDQGKLADLLNTRAEKEIDFRITAITNLALTSQPGPAGTSRDLETALERSAFKIDAESVQGIAKTLAAGTPVERMRFAQFLASMGPQLVRADDPAVKLRGGEMIDILKRSQDQQDASVLAWVQYCCVTVLPDAERAPIVEKMIASDAWQSKLLGLIAMETAPLPPGQQRGYAQKIAGAAAKGDLLKDYAEATIKLLDQSPQNPKP